MLSESPTEFITDTNSLLYLNLFVFLLLMSMWMSYKSAIFWNTNIYTKKKYFCEVYFFYLLYNIILIKPFLSYKKNAMLWIVRFLYSCELVFSAFIIWTFLFILKLTVQSLRLRRSRKIMNFLTLVNQSLLFLFCEFWELFGCKISCTYWAILNIFSRKRNFQDF